MSPIYYAEAQQTAIAQGRMKSSRADNFAITAFCATILIIACTIVGFYIRADMNCEAVGGIPIRVFAFPSFVECVR
jgi:hypothetical protein